MSLPITTSSATILGFWLVILSIRVVGARRTASVSLGDGGDQTLSRRIRAQGNLSEYAPLGLILIFLPEAQAGSTWLLAASAAFFVVGRLAHGYALSFTESNAIARMSGMIMTFTGLMALAALNLWVLLSHS
ncbi:MAG: MAPEG family protein [Pseudomonadota bacterium]